MGERDGLLLSVIANWDRIGECLQRARQGRGRAPVVEGPPGIGKTVLLATRLLGLPGLGDAVARATPIAPDPSFEFRP
jgi:hypothetical protein